MGRTHLNFSFFVSPGTRHQRAGRRRLLVGILLFSCATLYANSSPQATQCSSIRPFTIRDSIGISYLINPSAYSTAVELRARQPIGVPVESPDRRRFFVITQEGDLSRNEIRSTIWLFQETDIERHRDNATSSAPRNVVTLSARTNMPIISDVRWLDSSRIAFLGRNHSFAPRVFVADLHSGVVRAITRKGVYITAYDISNDVLAYATPAMNEIAKDDAPPPDDSLDDVTGKNIYKLLFPPRRTLEYLNEWSIRTVANTLHIVKNGRELPTSWTLGGTPLRLFAPIFRLSPDGSSIVLLAPMKNIPASWAQYRARSPLFAIDPSSSYKVAEDNAWKLERFVIIQLKTGKTTPLVDAPAGRGLSYLAATKIIWSRDSKRVLLSNTFLPVDNEQQSDRTDAPVVALIYLPGHHVNKVVSLPDLPKGKNGWYRVADVEWNDDGTVTLKYGYEGGEKDSSLPADESYAFRDATWYKLRFREKESDGFQISVQEELNQPPALYVIFHDKPKTLLWTPNSQLNCLRSGQARLFEWTDKNKYSWTGILVTPDKSPGQRGFPLVIQTHGVSPEKYFADGEFTTGSGGRALVAHNIAVLQMADAPHIGSPENPEDQLAGYEAAIDSLSATGLVDRSRVGVIGFSYTCYQALYALTHRPTLFKAATITDGNTMGYMQYMLATDSPNAKGALEIIEKTNGGSPFDGGLLNWMRTAPNFNLDKIATPLLISSLENDSILAQWETYAGLRILKKPVDMMWMRQTNAPHVLIEPRQRYFSQETAVDWFVFWLKDEEDTDPGKSLEYERWRTLRDLQRAITVSDAGSHEKR